MYFSILLNKAYDILYVMKNIEIKTSRYHALNEIERTSIDRFVHLCWGEQEEEVCIGMIFRFSLSGCSFMGR